jgi:hypothetical protein
VARVPALDFVGKWRENYRQSQAAGTERMADDTSPDTTIAPIRTARGAACPRHAIHFPIDQFVPT